MARDDNGNDDSSNKDNDGQGGDNHDTDDCRVTNLTKNEKFVWEALRESPEPLKAYEILDRLKEKGVRAPMTVYRALDGLEEKGIIHKLDGINAFVLCNHEAPHSVQTFMVCNDCGAVDEVAFDATIKNDIAPLVQAQGFHMEMARLEIKGQCQNCHA